MLKELSVLAEALIAEYVCYIEVSCFGLQTGRTLGNFSPASILTDSQTIPES